MSDPTASTPQSGQTTGRFNAAAVQEAMAEQPAADASGVSGMFQDASTLAATGLIAAALFAVVAGVINFFGDAVDVKDRLLLLTGSVDVGDVALLGIAVVLLLVTPDPPGGIERSTLLRATAVVAGITAGYEGVRAIVIAMVGGDFLTVLANFVMTLGVAIAAFTVAFYAAKESFLKQEGKI